MPRRVLIMVAVSGIAGALALPGVAGAKTKTVYAGGPPQTKVLAQKLLGKGFKAFVQKYQPGANNFVNQTVTINVNGAGDPHAVASAVADKQRDANADLIRYARALR